jgi:nucleoside-diphosphate-sugar epimerase
MGMKRDYSRILVTGGAGFIGSHQVDRLLSESFEVTVIDDLSTGQKDNVAHHKNKKGFRFIRGDIRDFKLIKKIAEDVDAIFHEAALTSVPFSVENPLLTNDINVTGTLNLLKASVDLHVKRFVFASSCAVYGNAPPPQKNETIVPNPTSPYGSSKLAAENYVRLFHQIYGLETVSLRYFNVYGPRQNFNINGSEGGVIPIFLNRLLKNAPPIVYGDGEQTRDFVHVQDVVEANMLALNSERAAGEVFNIATGTKASVNQVTGALKEILNRKNLETIYDSPRPGDIRNICADISKAKKVLGFHPKIALKEGLITLVDWYTKQSPIL